MIMLIMLILQE